METANYNSQQMPAEDITARTAVITGVISLIAWIIPIIGIPLSLFSLIVGITTLNSSRRRDMSRAGITLGIIGLFLSITYIIFIIYIISTGVFLDFTDLPLEVGELPLDVGL